MVAQINALSPISVIIGVRNKGEYMDDFEKLMQIGNPNYVARKEKIAAQIRFLQHKYRNYDAISNCVSSKIDGDLIGNHKMENFTLGFLEDTLKIQLENISSIRWWHKLLNFFKGEYE